MTKHYADYGPVFIMERTRSSNPNAKTLVAYMFKHRINSGAIELVLDKNDNMIEDLGNPIAKINWHDDCAVKKLDGIYDQLSSEIKATIESTFGDYKQNHLGK